MDEWNDDEGHPWDRLWVTETVVEITTILGLFAMLFALFFLAGALQEFGV
ncbi:hypothetical protein [Azospirillum thermophilum]|nr:hypothetical protein [Azospirillum thermophilum]